MSTQHSAWIAERMRHIDASGIRKVFDLGARLKDPIDLSIGQPHFKVPEAVQQAAIEAIRGGKSGYTVTQGIAPLRELLQRWVDERYRHADRQVFVTSGTSGGLALALLTLVNPGDEVILFDPYFVMYKHLTTLAGGKCVFVDTYPDFRVDPGKVRAALSPRTKCIVLNSPANPTGAVLAADETRAIAELAREANVALMSDEVYRAFCYHGPFHSPAQWNDQCIVVDGFSKSYAMTGWRLGFAHGPAQIIQEMIKLQQFTFVCAPQPVQWAGVAAWQTDVSSHVADYRRKRDLMLEGLRDHYEIPRCEGAFYLFPKAPWGTASEFVAEAIARNLLIIPGSVFSRRDTHFRLSYAADDAILRRGIQVLTDLAGKTRVGKVES
ncbi:MAG: aminotransferase class I/II-fold pyridoxal phosphate-dependent enzyme [Planctomycetes bacterium]|nr:aminotransferase class I/II-fold pyridoxal phosphate-dependent enzyme [Planctomycetota bacterium]